MVGPTREQARATLGEGQHLLEDLLTQLTDAQFERPKSIGGGDWSARHLLGHIAFWEELAGELLRLAGSDRRPRAADIGGAVTVDQANAEDLARSAGSSLADVRARATAAHEALLAGIRGATEAAWNAPLTYPGASDKTLGELAGGVTGAPQRPFGHAFAHLEDLRAYVTACATG